jgi:uncharacterized cofD-like protein
MALGTGRKAVAIGGGTGQPQILRCLLELGYDTCAVVTMADDGGSSGVLRRELGVLPPGDARNCLVAMADDEHSLLARAFQYRFPAGGLEGHALGNLAIAALADIAGDFAQAIELAGECLGSRGAVYPSTVEDVHLYGVDREGVRVEGQARLAANAAAISKVCLEPSSPAPYGPALEVIAEADLIVIGPGSLYTSIIPNFLVEGVADSVRSSRGQVVYVSNVANLRGETGGLDAADHLQALFDHGLGDCIDAAIVHESGCEHQPLCDDGSGVEAVAFGPEVNARIEALGVRVYAADVADPSNPVRHALGPLCRALEGVIA